MNIYAVARVRDPDEIQVLTNLVVDPIRCGCTDCITGVAIPFDDLTGAQLDALVEGGDDITDRTGWSERDWDYFLDPSEKVTP